MDWIRRFLQGMRAAPSDEELGRRSSVYPDENRSRKSTQLAYEEPNVVLETSEKLMEFRMLVGSESCSLVLTPCMNKADAEISFQ